MPATKIKRVKTRNIPASRGAAARRKNRERFQQGIHDSKLVRFILERQYKCENGAYRKLIYKYGVSKANTIIKNELKKSISYAGALRREINRKVLKEVKEKTERKKYEPTDEQLINLASSLRSTSTSMHEVMKALEEIKLKKGIGAKSAGNLKSLLIMLRVYAKPRK